MFVTGAVKAVAVFVFCAARVAESAALDQYAVPLGA